MGEIAPAPSAASSGGLAGAFLEAELGRKEVAVTVLVAAALGARAGSLEHGAVGALVAGVGLAVGALALVARRGRVGDLVLVTVVAGSLALSGLAPLTSFAPFVAQLPGRAPLLALRGFLILLALRRTAPSLAAADGEGRAPRAASRGLALLAALFLASLVVEGALVAGIVATALAGRRAAAHWPSAAPGAPRWLVPAVAVPALLLAAAPPRPAPRPESAPTAPADAVAYWRGRANPYRAHAVALAWAEKERPPGEGFLALAEVDWELGEKIKARKVLAKVLAADTARDVHERAEALARSWAATEVP